MGNRSMDWCPVCCTRHAAHADCPGELLATGPERHGRKFLVTHGSRLERYGVLIAEAGSLWRARILTYPNMLWTVPGGRGTIKFVGASAQEAEAGAVGFLQEHSRARGYPLREVDEPLDSGRVDPERDAVQSPRGSKEERHGRALPIRFGEQKAERAGSTADLSYGGLFVVTDKPLPAGRTLKMVLELEEYSIPLSGKVAWVRTQPKKGRPVGMGVELHQAPPLYVRYVKAAKERGAEPPAGEA